MRAGSSLNMVGTNLIGGHNLPPLVAIGLLYLPKHWMEKMLMSLFVRASQIFLGEEEEGTKT